MTDSFREILLQADAAGDGFQSVAEIVADRVYADGIKPANERRACIVLVDAGNTPDYHFEGPSDFSDGTVQVDVWAPTYELVSKLAKAAQAALEAFEGVAAGQSIGWIEIQNRLAIPTTTDEGAGRPTEYGITFDAEYLNI